MKKIVLLSIAFFMATQFIEAQQLSKEERMKWWREARFGLFIHWGVYAQLAGVYNGHEQELNNAEWIMSRMKIPVADYMAVAKQFNPIKFNADDWVKQARNAGMKFIIMTAKHHDGFAMFKSAASKWDIVDATPFGKDVVKELAAACKQQNMKLGFYYSQAQDWCNPGGAAARTPVREGWPNPDSARIDAYTKVHKGHWDPAQESKTFAQYIDDVAVPQVKEILTNYGDVAVLWWDTPTNMTDDAATKLQALLQLQPGIITNNRLKRPNFPGDIKTPEQKIPTQAELDGQDWETCMTMNGSWGYRASDTNWKSAETLIYNLCDIASKGGNFLLNVGPKPDGMFPSESMDRLQKIGAWMHVNGEAIYDTKGCPLAALPLGRCTMKESKNSTTLYLILFDYPKNGKLVLPELKNSIRSATLLITGATLSTTAVDGGIIINVPASARDAIAPVVKLQLKGMVENVNLPAHCK